MKKSFVICAGLTTALLLASCGSKESAYRKAYDRARAAEQEQTQTQTQTPATTVTTPVVTTVTPVTTQTPANTTTITDNNDNVSVREENVSLVSGSGLKAFSVVVGSFSLPANAQGLQATLKAAGYDAQIVKNNERNLYRVVASTYSDKGQAVQSRDRLRATYPDAWLLYNK